MTLFNVYRVLAYVVGVLLAFCSLVVFPLAHWAPAGSSLQEFGESAGIMWMFHGFIYMIYVVVAFLLAVRARWSITFTVLMLVAGIVPLLIFWVEHHVAAKVRAENPDLVGQSMP